MARVIVTTYNDTAEYNILKAEYDILAASAGGLLYEASKQCVNAVANLRGRDPQRNHEKMSELSRIIAAHPVQFDLMGGARSAWRLHIHADQFNLPPQEFSRNFITANGFIAEMLAVYRSIRPGRQV